MTHTEATDLILGTIWVTIADPEYDRVRGRVACVIDTARAAAFEEAAKVAEYRHENWRFPHPDDAEAGEVCCDVTACEDIATAIRALAQSHREPKP